jgi:hypothetical protein
MSIYSSDDDSERSKKFAFTEYGKKAPTPRFPKPIVEKIQRPSARPKEQRPPKEPKPPKPLKLLKETEVKTQNPPQPLKIFFPKDQKAGGKITKMENFKLIVPKKNRDDNPTATIPEHAENMSDDQSVDPNRPVSSQGCSRVFIVKVLLSVADCVKGKILPSIFTFQKEVVKEWLVTARISCSLPSLVEEERIYGGPQFDMNDMSTHWTEPHQLYTWWKNNVERKSKFKILQQDAVYKGVDYRRTQRYFIL